MWAKCTLAVQSSMATLFTSFYHGLLVLLTRGFLEYGTLLVFHAGALYIFCTFIKYIYCEEPAISLQQSHWSSGSTLCIPSWGTRVQSPGGYLSETGILLLALSAVIYIYIYIYISQDRTERTGRQNGEGRTGQAERDKQAGQAEQSRTGQVEWDRQNGKGRTGQAEKDKQKG